MVGDFPSSIDPVSTENTVNYSTIDQGIRHHRGPGPQQRLPQLQPGSLLASFNAVPPLVPSAGTIRHADPPGRHAMPTITFDRPPREAAGQATAHVPPAMTAFLSDVQHNRVAALLSVPFAGWHGFEVNRLSDAQVEVSCTIDDPQPAPGTRPARIPVALVVSLGTLPGAGEVEVIRLGTNHELVLPVRDRRSFSDGDSTVEVLVPHRNYTEPQQAALARRDRAHLACGADSATVTYSYMSFGTVDGAREIDVSIALRREAILDTWVVSSVDARCTQTPPLTLQPDCATWLTDDAAGPRLLSLAITSIKENLDIFGSGRPLPGVLKVRRNAYGMRMELDVMTPGGNPLESVRVCLNFVQHGQRYVVAYATVRQPRSLDGKLDTSHHERPSTRDWQNPFARSGNRSLNSSITSAEPRFLSSVRARSPGESEDGRVVRPRIDNDASARPPPEAEAPAQACEFVEEFGPGNLKLAETCRFAKGEVWAVRLRNAGFNPATARPEARGTGSRPDYRKMAEQLVAQANAARSRFRGASVVVCERMPLPESFNLAGRGCTLELTLSPDDADTVTGVGLSIISNLPTPRHIDPRPLTFKAPEKRESWMTAIKRALDKEVPGFQGVRDGIGTNWEATARNVVKSCMDALEVLDVGTDSMNRRVLEYRDVEIDDENYHVHLKFSDAAANEVCDFRLFRTDTVEAPKTTWFLRSA